MHLLATCWQVVLYAPQYIANVREGPRAEMIHAQSRLVVEIRVAVDLILLIVQQGLL